MDRAAWRPSELCLHATPLCPPCAAGLPEGAASARASLPSPGFRYSPPSDTLLFVSHRQGRATTPRHPGKASTNGLTAFRVRALDGGCWTWRCRWSGRARARRTDPGRFTSAESAKARENAWPRYPSPIPLVKNCVGCMTPTGAAIVMAWADGEAADADLLKISFVRPCGSRKGIAHQIQRSTATKAVGS